MLEIEVIRFYISLFVQILAVFVAIIGGMLTTKLLSSKVERDSIINKLSVLKISNDRLQQEIDYHLQAIKEYSIEVFISENFKEMLIEIENKTFDIEKDKYYASKHLSESTVRQYVKLIQDSIIHAIQYYEKGSITDDNWIDDFLKSIKIQEGSLEHKIMKLTLKNIIRNENDSRYSNGINATLLRHQMDFDVPPIYAYKEINKRNDEVDKLLIELKHNDRIIDTLNNQYISLENDLNLKFVTKYFVYISIFGIIMPLLGLLLISIYQENISLLVLIGTYSVLSFLTSILLIINIPNKINKLN